MIQTPGATLRLDGESGDSDSQRRMVQNARTLLKRVKALSDADRNALADVTMNRCALVRVVVNDKDQGFKVFRVLNTRGKEPGAHDIIKTELFQRSKFTTEEASFYSERWAEHEAALGGSAFDDLLRQIRSIYDKSSKGELITGFLKNVIPKITARGFLDDVLPRYVAAYKIITTANLDTGPRFNKVNENIGNSRTLYGRGSPFNITKDESRRAFDRMLGRFATFGQRRSMALRLNAALDGGFTIAPQSDATVEHVLPRNISEDSHWMITWPDPAKRREQCDTLGNFVLLTNKVNQKADRLDYRAKKEVYFNGGGGQDFALTRDLVDQEAWTSEVVRKRTERLAEILMMEWSLA